MFGFAIICQIENNLLIMKILSPVYWTYYVVCLKVPYLDHFCTYNILIFMFEYCQNKLPPSFQSMFMFNHGLNTLRKTRQSDFFYVRYCKSAFAQKLPLYCFPSVWNKWITSTVNVKSKSQFKQVVTSKMLASYSNS